MLKNKFRNWFKKSAKKWQTCGGLTVSGKWAKGVTVIDVIGKLTQDDNCAWQIRIFNEKTSWLFFEFQDASDMLAGKKLLEKWIKDIQG